MYKALILIILFIGILLVAIQVVRIQAGLIEQKPKIEYRYIPRTFEEEQEDPVYPSEIFETMFSQPSPWIVSVRSYDQRKQEQVNAYFVSQL
ncbi:hypothetical protein Klosneuvirus_1_23 [Klosneuvirus KNV1]|uniref:Uncharacterized protein n=1 Tax=Klosneuvirus KNV1 TaxID=1977640 RepID=A0A1V0SHF6_9VIRU|nr:hypothetical protein Klosneuvirus_1_23 [Klosneuvirus KNV1]